MIPSGMLILEPTLACDSACSACYNRARLNPERKSRITMSEIEAVAGALPNLLILSLSGGEPFLHPDLAEVVALFDLHSTPSYISIPTNGLNPGKIESAVEKIAYATEAALAIDLSIDGLGGDHDRIRGVPGNFPLLCETYDRLKRLLPRRKNLRLSANTCVSSLNVSNIHEIAEWVRREWPEAEGHSFSLVRNPGEPGVALEGSSVTTALSTMEGLLRGRKRYRGLTGMANHAFWSVYYRLSRDFHAGNPRRWHCSAGVKSLYVNGVADVAPCELLPPLGNLRDFSGSLPRLLDSPVAREAQKGIEAFRCRCDHSCWMQHSMLDARNWHRLAAGAWRSLRRR